MTPADGPRFPREALVAEIADRAREEGPVGLSGPPGAGKTWLLSEAASRLHAAGWQTCYVDLLGAASSPERFVRAAVRALPRAAQTARASDVSRVLRLADGGKDHGADAVHALFDLWASLDAVDGRPLALLLDEPTEMRSLAYFGGLREVENAFGSALAARARGTVLATSFPTATARLWPALTQVAVPPLSRDEVARGWSEGGLAVDPARAFAACLGSPRYARVLAGVMGSARNIEDAWASAMSLGGPLEVCCRHTWETLLLRSRGYGMSKAVLGAVAEEEGLNLTALVGRLGRSPGSIRDYLGWLTGVDALRMEGKRYFYVDGMVRWWVRLHGRGVFASAEDLAAAAREATDAAPSGSAPEPDRGPEARAAKRNERLMEMD